MTHLATLHGGGLAIEDEDRLDPRRQHADGAVEHALDVAATADRGGKSRDLEGWPTHSSIHLASVDFKSALGPTPYPIPSPPLPASVKPPPC